MAWLHFFSFVNIVITGAFILSNEMNEINEVFNICTYICSLLCGMTCLHLFLVSELHM